MLAEAPVVHQRARGRAVVSFRAEGTRSRLLDLYQSGCLKLRLPRVRGPVPETVLINTAGGLTGGDRLAVEARAGEGARLAVASQTAERLYRSAGGEARIEVRLIADAGARLAWLPQETIAFEGSALRRSLTIDLAPDARLLAVEPLVLGRAAMGERIERMNYRDDWRVRIGGRLVHAEALALGPDAGAWIARRAGWNGRTAGASALMVAPEAPALVEEARRIVGECGAVDAWDGPHARLIARVLAEDGFALRRRLVPLLSLLHGATMGLGCPDEGHARDWHAPFLPVVWSL